MFRVNDENIPVKVHNQLKSQQKFDLENKFKTKQSAFKLVSRVEKSKTYSKRVFEIKKMSKVDLTKYNIDFKKDKGIVDKLFELKNSNYKGTRFVI